jgi:hypothetical protein
LVELFETSTKRCISEVMDLAANDDDTDDGGGKYPPIVLDNLLSTTEQHYGNSDGRGDAMVAWPQRGARAC